MQSVTAMNQLSRVVSQNSQPEQLGLIYQQYQREDTIVVTEYFWQLEKNQQ